VISLIISSSILSADYLNLERDINALENASADAIHIDIMDGRFVQNTTWGSPTVSAIRKITRLPLEVHLMICQPECQIEEYVDAGVDVIFIHLESTVHLRRTLQLIRQSNIKAGVALKLETPVDVSQCCLDLVDVVLLLTCDDGFGGQPFQPLALQKISQLKELQKANNFNFRIEVDGGIGIESGQMCKNAGADVLVAGSFIFNHPKSMAKAIQLLKNV